MTIKCRYCDADTEADINKTFVDYKCTGCEAKHTLHGAKAVKEAKKATATPELQRKVAQHMEWMKGNARKVRR